MDIFVQTSASASTDSCAAPWSESRARGCLFCWQSESLTRPRTGSVFVINIMISVYCYSCLPSPTKVQEFLSAPSLDCLCQAAASSWSGGTIQTQDYYSWSYSWKSWIFYGCATSVGDLLLRGTKRSNLRPAIWGHGLLLQIFLRIKLFDFLEK